MEAARVSGVIPITAAPQSFDALLAEAPARKLVRTSPFWRRAGSTRSSPMRSLPGRKSPLPRKAPRRVGTASIIPSGRGCRRRRWST